MVLTRVYGYSRTSGAVRMSLPLSVNVPELVTLKTSIFHMGLLYNYQSIDEMISGKNCYYLLFNTPKIFS
jgi:hypothetical protein